MKKIMGWKEHLGRLLKGVGEDEKKLNKSKDDFRDNLAKMIENEELRRTS